MKKGLFLIIIFVLAVIISCVKSSNNESSTPDKNKKFRIEGNISNGAGKKLYLKKIGSSQAADSSIIDKKDKFRLESFTDNPELFTVQTENGAFFVICVRGNEKINVTADYMNFQDYSISGSDESLQVQDLVKKTRGLLEKIGEIARVSKDSIDSPFYSAIKTKLNTDYTKIMDDFRAYSRSFINKNNTSPVSLLALKNQIGPEMYVFDPSEEKALYLQVDSILMSLYPKSELIISFHNEINNYYSQLEAYNSPTGSLSEGVEAPDISLPSPDGKVINLHSLKGKYVLLDFWASWCPPCRAENPNLVLNYQKYRSKGFEIYQVSLDRTKEDWLKGIKDDKLDWIHVSDLKYWNSYVVPLYGIRGIPANYLLDKEGKILAANLRGPELGDKLSALFNK